MKITDITVSAGLTFNHPYESYSNFRPNVTYHAAVEEGEDKIACTRVLQELADNEMERWKQKKLCMLEEEEEQRLRKMELRKMEASAEDDDREPF